MTKIVSHDQLLTIKNYNLQILDQLKTIASPIENYGIQFLTFRRIYTDGKLIHFSNNEVWLDHSFDHQLWQSTSSLKRISKIGLDKQYAHVWDNNAHTTDHVYNAMYQHNLWHGLTLYDRRQNYVDLWAFATDRNNTEILDFYINELNIIKKFILYLQDKTYSIFFPTNVDVFIKTDKTINLVNKENSIYHTENIFNIKKYYLDFEKKIYLTNQEFLCVYYLSKGKSFKEIANLLNISPRTVEDHIHSVQRKSDSHFKGNVLKKCQYLLNMYQ
ncbi:MAG: helix-turn-helix transcriptional regulator [Rickettsia endosymbiont of Platyusa sonomae]|nr:helix-turn-helix transcriptional regulator [Rickettsia endosymbiont of Platyusa sonomae]